MIGCTLAVNINPRLGSKNINHKRNKGYTLIEAVIALALWMIISLGIFVVWQHITQQTTTIITHQNTFENARGAMDAIITNVQMSRNINLEVCNNYILWQMSLPGYDAQGRLRAFDFDFNVNAPEGHTMHHRLNFGENELASNIALVQIRPVNYTHLQITIETSCTPPIILESSVDIRHKYLTVTRR